MISRRDMLSAMMAGLVFPSFGHAAGTKMTLRPEPVSLKAIGGQSEWGGLLGFNGSIPGPEIRVQQGAKVDVRLDNGLREGAAIHWHGVRVPNRMDGVPILTQEVVPPGSQFDYRFSPPDAGTFWYHSHYLSYEQVGRGLFGPLIVEERNPPDVDQDITFMLTDFKVTPRGEFDTDFSVQDEFSTAGRLGSLLAMFPSEDSVQQGGRVRLRLINAAIDRVFALEIAGLNGFVVALDGMPLVDPTPFGRLIVAPSQRVDIIGDVLAHIEVASIADGHKTTAGRIKAKANDSTKLRGLVQPLPQHNLQEPGTPKRELKLVMQGGVGGVEHGGFGSWAFNDVSGLPRQPLGRFRRGDTGVVHLLNQTDFPHAVHLHGHHFREVLPNKSVGPFRDTLLVQPWESKQIACVFDNVGRWLMHCHMLSHSIDGMATWIEVS
jgi:FtsP/CotA-like multicopper oxidase with cupredoxin domain